LKSEGRWHNPVVQDKKNEMAHPRPGRTGWSLRKCQPTLLDNRIWCGTPQRGRGRRSANKTSSPNSSAFGRSIGTALSS